MIKFFRSIRRGLLEKGHKAKYLKYAIGEIVLVVIGILIALQINNWNENRLTRIAELKMIENLKVALQSDLNDIIGNISSHQSSIESQKIVLQWLQSDLPYADSLCYHFAYSNMFSVFVSNNSAFESLKIKGFDLISNDRLRDDITYLYEFSYDIYAERELVYNNLVQKMIQDINSKYFSNTFIDPLKSESLIGCTHPNVPDQIKSSTEYNYYLSTLKEFNLFLINTMINTQTNLEAILAAIETEYALENN